MEKVTNVDKTFVIINREKSNFVVFLSYKKGLKNRCILGTSFEVPIF